MLPFFADVTSAQHSGKSKSLSPSIKESSREHEEIVPVLYISAARASSLLWEFTNVIYKRNGTVSCSLKARHIGDRVAKLKVGVWCRLDIAPGWLLPWDRNGSGCRARGNIPAKHKEHKSVSCTLAWDWAGAMVSFCLLVGVQWQGAVLTQSRARKSYL